MTAVSESDLETLLQRLEYLRQAEPVEQETRDELADAVLSNPNPAEPGL